MKVVVDTNILFSYFWENSFTKNILTSYNFEFISSEKAIDEIKKYSEYIIEKTGMSLNSFENKLEELMNKIKFFEKEEDSIFYKKATEISPDKADVEFFAICLKEKCFLWSNDSMLKNQDFIKVLNAKEIIEIIF